MNAENRDALGEKVRGRNKDYKDVVKSMMNNLCRQLVGTVLFNMFNKYQ